MAVGETAKLIASLELANKMGPGLASVNRDLGKLESRGFKAGQQIGTGIKNAGKIAAVGIAALASQVILGLDSLVELEKQEAQTGAVLKSTGQAAGQNAADITRLSEKYEALNAQIGDEFIRSAQNMILTFTNIKGKAFEPTLEAVLNLNTAMGKGPEGLTSTAIQVGKALNDPTKGLTALRKVGVSFTESQQKKIATLQKEGKLYEAQKIILKELNKEFGGSFAAQGDTTAGKVAKFHDSIEDLQRTLAAGFLPVVSKTADALSTMLADPAVIKGVSDFGTKLAGLFSDENLNTGAKILKSLFQTAKDVAPAIASAAKVTGAVVKTAVDMFTSLPRELQTLLVGGLAVNKLTGGLVTNIAGGLISSVLKQLVSGVVNVNGGVVNVTGAGGLPGATGGAAKPAGGLGAVGKVVGGAVIIGGVALTAETIASMAEQNAAAADRGLNPAEIAAQHYYSASQADQSTIAKRLGYVPTREDFNSGTAKLKGAVDNSTATVESMRARLGAKIDANAQASKTAGIEAGLAAKNAGDLTKAQIASSAMIQQALLSAQMATTRTTASATQGTVRGVAPPIVGAIRAIPRPVTYVSVNITASNVTRATTTQNSYGPGNGSSGQAARPSDSGV